MKRLTLLSLVLIVACDVTPAGTLPPSGAEAPGAVVPLATAKMRVLQPGDTWAYVVRIRFTPTGSEAFSLWEGTRRDLVSEVSDPQLGAVVAMTIATETSIVEGEGIGTATEVVSLQDRFLRLEDGRLQWVARQFENTVSYIVSPDGGVPPQLSAELRVGDSFSLGDVLFDDGLTITHNQVVTGIETVTVPLGTFEAYRVEFTATASKDGIVDTEIGTLWWVPALGAHVKLELTRDMLVFNGQQDVPDTQTLTAELTSTSVSL